MIDMHFHPTNSQHIIIVTNWLMNSSPLVFHVPPLVPRHFPGHVPVLPLSGLIGPPAARSWARGRELRNRRDFTKKIYKQSLPNGRSRKRMIQP